MGPQAGPAEATLVIWFHPPYDVIPDHTVQTVG